MRTHLLSVRVRDGRFAHWPADPAVVDAHLPAGVGVATYDERAWLGVVAFVMEDIRPRGSRVGRTFPEVNLRTYVTRGEESGVYFFSLDADDRLSVSAARSAVRAPVLPRADGRRPRGRPPQTAERTRPPGRAPRTPERLYGRDDDSFVPEPGSLPAFLTENDRFYARGTCSTRSTRLYRDDIAHEPWRLVPADATVHEESLFRAAGFESPTGEPLVHVAEPLDVTAGSLATAEE
ncbi:hypothetical protein C2R22_06125 [Salinigranum rubrum]|uniref:DUF2071 domain-containing protein n=1 Tax=Salinigranum rubrum TaxID=755307 RepID=A0A2I8VHC9_9EURY|nr:DUF2071 domain-containing protein [Salinigranum rubrum]AUV81294.1 hypothetical protein C2R22_06125 [Salinigranum rubrum]